MNCEKINILKEYVPELTDHQLDRFIRYHEMLVETNKVMNLTAITEFDDVVVKHFADSLSIVCEDKCVGGTVLLTHPTTHILDIGTGAGFPGIPLKIAFPDISITLLDSLGKRVNFLNDVINELDLNDEGHIEAIHSRAEDYIREPGIRESYDLVVSRAVASLNILSEYAIPYVKPDGYFVAYKSEKTEEELKESQNALKILGGEVSDTRTFTLPDSDISRTLITIKKTCLTPDKYPRKAGLPSKKPL